MLDDNKKINFSPVHGVSGVFTVKKCKISVVGCALADYLYTNIDFSAPDFQKYASKTAGDGGITPGKLVFASDLANFARQPITEILNEITHGAEPKAFNLGGPAIVAAVNAAQLLYGKAAEFDYYGAFGNDESADKLLALLRRLPVNLDNLQRKEGISPFTYVLSDAKYHNHKGERAFVNNVGTAELYSVSDIPEKFFNCDIAFYSATALVPAIHDNLRQLLARSKANGALNVVATVFDFRNEKRNPDAPWPLGDSVGSYPLIDLLLMDYDEASRLSGQDNFDAVCNFFINSGVGAFVITHGAHEFFVWSGGKLFQPISLRPLPVCAAVDLELERHPELRGDTTGCGDNFAGGFLGSLVDQLLSGKQPGEFDLYEASAWGSASGGFACFCIGGTYFEGKSGEKQSKVMPFVAAYRRQLSEIPEKMN